MSMFDDDGDVENSPLAKTFGMVPDGSLNEEYASLEIPDTDEARDLNLVIELALNAYKSIMDDIALIEPKNRLKYLEVAERYLGQAKDARYKLESLALQAKRLSGKKGSDGKSEKEEPKSGMSRKDLFGMAAASKTQ